MMITEAAEKNPILVPLVGLASGIMIGRCGLPLWTAAVFAIAATAIFFIIHTADKNPAKAYKLNSCNYLWILLFFSATGILSEFVAKPYCIDQNLISSMQAVKGRVKNISYRNSGDRIIFSANGYFSHDSIFHSIPASDIIIYTDGSILRPGDDIILPANLRPVTDPENVYIPGYADRLKRNGIYYTINVSGDNIHKTGHNETIGTTALRIRDRIASAIELTPLDKELQGFLITILLGDKDYSDSEMRRYFSDAGISHILALSGMHVAIIASFFLWILFPFNFLGKYKIRIICVIILIWLYAIITGLAPSTTRAALMFSMAGAAQLLERKNSSFNALCAAAFIILLFTPQAIADEGFQLSFICVASLIAFAGYFNSIDRRNHPRLYKLNSMIISTLVATSASWLLAAYYFNTIPTLFLPANLIALPLLPMFLILSIASILCSSAGFDIMPLNHLLDGAYSTFTGFIKRLAMTGDGSAIHLSPSLGAVLLWISGLICIAIYIHTRNSGKKYALAAGIPMIAASLSLLLFSPSESAISGFIIQNRFDTVSIMKYEAAEQSLHLPPQKSISMIHAPGADILTADCCIDADNPPALPSSCDVMIISRGFSGDISALVSLVTPKLIVIHRSVFPKREATLIEECRRLGIRCHSIRHQGAYRTL